MKKQILNLLAVCCTALSACSNEGKQQLETAGGSLPQGLCQAGRCS